MYKMFIITEKVARVKGMEVENKFSLSFVSKSMSVLQNHPVN